MVRVQTTYSIPEERFPAQELVVSLFFEDHPVSVALGGDGKFFFLNISVYDKIPFQNHSLEINFQFLFSQLVERHPCLT